MSGAGPLRHRLPVIVGLAMGLMLPWMMHVEGARIAFIAAHVAVLAAVGALALAVPLAVTAAVLGKAALGSAAGRCGFGLVLAMVLYSFGENLEMLAYLCWPAWLAIGVALASPPYNDQVKA